MRGKKRPLPIGLQSFSTIIEENFVYIDKTRYIYDLIAVKRYYFLSRPRRFGKTLLISTLQELFSGSRHLFTSLYIDKTDYTWQKHPVITISFASMASKSAKLLEKALEWTLAKIAEQYQVDISDAPTIGTKFKALIMQLSVLNKVVVLIDEYDHTILKNIENPEVADECREVLSDFFAPLKDVEVDKQLRFVFITGISKFSKTSIFSGLNNLTDLSLDHRTAKLLGYTTEEIALFYKEYIEEISHGTKKSQGEILEQIRFWYNGYQFCDPEGVVDTKVYNPFSVMLYLESKNFLNYWFDSGTPTFLMRLLEKQQFPLHAIEGSEVNIEETKSYEIKKLRLIPLLWQAGYLTIDSYNPDTKNFRLIMPNEEVKVAFYQNVMSYITETELALITSFLYKLSESLGSGNLKSFFDVLKIFFAQIPYTIQLADEKYYQSLFFIILKLIGAPIESEVVTNNGRIDAVIETKSQIFLFEFKLNGSCESALAQIEEKKYFQKYLDSKKEKQLVGVTFDTKERNITNWVVSGV
jgi:hypothetical protein